jgi:hypothetical protein
MICSKMEIKTPIPALIYSFLFIGLALLISIPIQLNKSTTIHPEKAAQVDSMIVFSVKPSDKMLIALWDSDLKSYVFMKYRADSIAKGIGTTLIHRDDR